MHGVEHSSEVNRWDASEDPTRWHERTYGPCSISHVGLEHQELTTENRQLNPGLPLIHTLPAE